jgi:hypothetical protein
LTSVSRPARVSFSEILAQIEPIGRSNEQVDGHDFVDSSLGVHQHELDSCRDRTTRRSSTRGTGRSSSVSPCTTLSYDRRKREEDWIEFVARSSSSRRRSIRSNFSSMGHLIHSMSSTLIEQSMFVPIDIVQAARGTRECGSSLCLSCAFADRADSYASQLNGQSHSSCSHSLSLPLSPLPFVDPITQVYVCVHRSSSYSRQHLRTYTYTYTYTSISIIKPFVFNRCSFVRSFFLVSPNIH